MHNPGMLLAILLWAGAPAAEPMTGDAILRKSADAYAALTSYVGSAMARGSASTPGTNQSLEAAANVTFLRPGKLHIRGWGTRKNGYAIISDGKETWFADTIRKHGAYEKAESVNRADTALAGSTLSVPTLMVALLMDLPVGHPLRGVTGSRLDGHETIDGKDCLRVVAAASSGRKTFWIDSASFLLRQMKEERQAPPRADGGSAAASPQRLYTFFIQQLNQPVNEKVFQPPTRPLDLLSIPPGTGRILEK